MLQILNAIFTRESESGSQSKSRVSLIFANQTEDDILCRSYLEEIAQRNPERLKIWYTLSQPPAGKLRRLQCIFFSKSKITFEVKVMWYTDCLDWSRGVGRVSGEMFQSHLFPPSSNGIQLLCGPAPMISSSCLPALQELGYETSRCFVYWGS